MSVRALLASRKTTRASALVLAVCLGLFALLGAAAPTQDASEEPPFRFTGRFGQGVCDTLWVWAHRLDEASQDVLTEQALQAARAAEDDASDATTSLSADATDTGRHAKDVESSRSAQESAEKEALRAADQALSSETPATASSTKTFGQTNGSADSPTNLICFLGEEVTYIQGGPADTSAPYGFASTWVGTGRVSDNANTYFIGHNPGVFARVMDLEVGDKITVFDDTGASRTYYVFDTLFLPNRSNYFVYEGRIAPTGETITLQTCTGDNQRVRCVMAR